MSNVILRPKTEEAKAILEQFGDVWTVGITIPDPVYGSSRRVYIECRSDSRSKGMWVNEKYDELFELIYM